MKILKNKISNGQKTVYRIPFIKFQVKNDRFFESFYVFIPQMLQYLKMLVYCVRVIVLRLPRDDHIS